MDFFFFLDRTIEEDRKCTLCNKVGVSVKVSQSSSTSAKVMFCAMTLSDGDKTLMSLVFKTTAQSISE